jgi:hypothetical protein
LCAGAAAAGSAAAAAAAACKLSHGSSAVVLTEAQNQQINAITLRNMVAQLLVMLQSEMFVGSKGL